MKKYFLIVLQIGIINSVFVKSEPKVAKLLKGIESNYSTKTIQLEFTYSFKGAESGEVVEKGKMTFSEDNYYLELPDQAIYFDGSTQWTYFKDRKEVQITNSTLEESAFHPLKFLNLYKSDKFKSRIVEDDGQATIIEFIPLSKNEEYHKIRVSVQPKLKQLQLIEVFLKNGDKYKVIVKRQLTIKALIKKNYQLDLDSLKGVHVEDLR